jgi:hypothetical protein
MKTPPGLFADLLLLCFSPVSQAVLGGSLLLLNLKSVGLKMA